MNECPDSDDDDDGNQRWFSSLFILRPRKEARGISPTGEQIPDHLTVLYRYGTIPVRGHCGMIAP
ncbi:hypothetical protein [Methanoregula sp.]|uniref:hypothetical protein n=1 Tax=Methanoregula sp. TaxID=2052170 RepID=UPI003564A83A